jgi:hypothetical protein
MKIRCTQQFLHQGAPVKVGETVEMEDFTARSIIHQGSAVEVAGESEAPPAAKAEPKRAAKSNE